MSDNHCFYRPRRSRNSTGYWWPHLHRPGAKRAACRPGRPSLTEKAKEGPVSRTARSALAGPITPSSDTRADRAAWDGAAKPPGRQQSAVPEEECVERPLTGWLRLEPQRRPVNRIKFPVTETIAQKQTSENTTRDGHPHPPGLQLIAPSSGKKSRCAARHRGKPRLNCCGVEHR